MCAVASAGGNILMMDKNKSQEILDDFYEEIFEEVKKYGKIEDIQVCENLGDHMVGNVYIKYIDEEDASNALQGLNGRFYAGRILACEFSPVTDFREARCRQYDEVRISLNWERFLREYCLLTVSTTFYVFYRALAREDHTATSCMSASHRGISAVILRRNMSSKAAR